MTPPNKGVEERELIRILDWYADKIKKSFRHAIISDFGWRSMTDGESPLFERLLSWHRRHSGRPSREKIAEMARNFYENTQDVYQFADAILSLYPSPEPRTGVSRRDIRRVLSAHSVAYMDVENDLCSLFGVEEEPAWCEHTKLIDGSWGINSSSDNSQPVFMRSFGGLRVDDFKVCPLCTVPRPGGPKYPKRTE